VGLEMIYLHDIRHGRVFSVMLMIPGNL